MSLQEIGEYFGHGRDAGLRAVKALIAVHLVTRRDVQGAEWTITIHFPTLLPGVGLTAGDGQGRLPFSGRANGRGSSADACAEAHAHPHTSDVDEDVESKPTSTSSAKADSSSTSREADPPGTVRFDAVAGALLSRLPTREQLSASARDWTERIVRAIDDSDLQLEFATRIAWEIVEPTGESGKGFTDRELARILRYVDRGWKAGTIRSRAACFIGCCKRRFSELHIRWESPPK